MEKQACGANLHPEFLLLLSQGPQSFLPHNIPLRWLDVLHDQGVLFTKMGVTSSRIREECTEFMNALLTLLSGEKESLEAYIDERELYNHGLFYTLSLNLERLARAGYIQFPDRPTVTNFFDRDRPARMEIGQALKENFHFFGQGTPDTGQMIELLFQQRGSA